MGLSMQIYGNLYASAETELKDSHIYGETMSKDCPTDGGFCEEYDKVGLQSSLLLSRAKDVLITDSLYYPHSKVVDSSQIATFNMKAKFTNVIFENFKSST